MSEDISTQIENVRRLSCALICHHMYAVITDNSWSFDEKAVSTIS